MSICFFKMAPATGSTKNTTLTNCIGERVKEITNISQIESVTHQITPYRRRRRRRFFPGSVPHSFPQCGESVINPPHPDTTNSYQSHQILRHVDFLPHVHVYYRCVLPRQHSFVDPFQSGQLQERGRDGVPYRSGHRKIFLRTLTIPTPTIDCIYRSKHTIRVAHVPHAWTRFHRLKGNFVGACCE